MASGRLLCGATVLRPGCMSGRGGIRRARASAVCEAVGGWVVRFIVGQPTAGGVGPAAVAVCRDGGE